MNIKFSENNVDSRTYIKMFQEAFQITLNKFKSHIDHHPVLSLLNTLIHVIFVVIVITLVLTLKLMNLKSQIMILYKNGEFIVI